MEKKSTFLVLLSTLVSLLVLPNSAMPALLTFESLPRLTFVTTQFESVGVIFTHTGVAGKIVDFVLGDFGTADFGSSPSQALAVGGLGSSTTATFVDPATHLQATVNHVSFRAGDGDNDPESFSISFFDINGMLLNQQNFATTSGSVNGGVDIMFSHPGIARVLMDSTGGGSGFNIDDFAFPNIIQSVPDPSTFTLLGLGVTGLFGWGWWRKRRA